MNKAKCTKFQANIFDQTKCQQCFRSKDQHSSEALENSKTARKVSKCEFLFIAPETFDFSNAKDRTRRWQRRFFILYDDGELTYSLNDHAETIPQGTVDMNICEDVLEAGIMTGHNFSLLIKFPQARMFIKGTSKEAMNMWYDVLSIFPWRKV